MNKHLEQEIETKTKIKDTQIKASIEKSQKINDHRAINRSLTAGDTLIHLKNSEDFKNHQLGRYNNPVGQKKIDHLKTHELYMDAQINEHKSKKNALIKSVRFYKYAPEILTGKKFSEEKNNRNKTAIGMHAEAVESIKLSKETNKKIINLEKDKIAINRYHTKWKDTVNGQKGFHAKAAAVGSKFFNSFSDSLTNIKVTNQMKASGRK